MYGGLTVSLFRAIKIGMKSDRPEYTEEQIAFFRECGRKGGKKRKVSPKSREASRRVMLQYWADVKAGKRYHRPVRKPKQTEFELKPKNEKKKE